MHYCSVLEDFEGMIACCYENNGGYFIIHGTPVNYCPFCGKKAPKQIFTKDEIAKSPEQDKLLCHSYDLNYDMYVEYDKKITEASS